MTHEAYMEAALDQARLARAAGEVPIGAIVVVGGSIVATGFNQPISSVDPTAHAEVVALRAAAQAVGNYRLTDAVVYVTLEPCLMCVGALVHARVREVVYGAAEPKTGALASTMQALSVPQLNHRFTVTGGVLEADCRDIVQGFFAGRRSSGRDGGRQRRPDRLRDAIEGATMSRKKFRPHLWYATEAEEAARLYTSIFPDSKIERVWSLQADSPSGPPGSVKVVDFTLFGQPVQAMSAGPHHDFNDAISLVVECDDQAELDRYWNAILEAGGTPQACGWINDRFGVRWQIVPAVLDELMRSSDQASARRVAEAMLKMVKLDVAALEQAARGTV